MDGSLNTRWILAAAAIVSIAGGCERRDPQARALVEAKNTLAAAGSGGSSAAPKSTLEASYAKVLATVKEDGDASDATKAINAAMSGNALGGQGELAAGEFREADARLLMALNAAKAKLGLYASQRGLAASLSGYDPQTDIARFDDQINERERELAAAKKSLADNEAKVNEIRGRAKAKADQARSMMEALGPQRESLLNASSADRPTLAKQLNDARRQAEAVMKESELLDAEAAEIAPRSIEHDLKVKQVEQQIAALNSAKGKARELAASLAQQAAEATKGAEQTGVELAAAVASVQTLLADDVKPAFEAALSKLSQAAGKFGQSRGGPEQGLQSVSVGVAAQAVGSLQREYGDVLARVAAVLDMAAKTQPPIAGASDFAAAGETIAGESKQAFAAALEQYEKAKSSMRSGGSAEVRERMDLLSRKIDETWVRLGGVPPEEPKAEEPAPEPAPEEAAPAPEGEGESSMTAPDAVPEGEAPVEEEKPAEEPQGEAPGHR